MKIGFFDSGLGGLTILKAARAFLPQYDYVYFGDTAHVPYGDKTEDEIYTLTLNGVQTLFEAGALLVIVACNSASAESVRRLQDTMLKEKYPHRKILGVIIPTIETIIETKARAVMVIGTQRTIDSHKYERELCKVETKHITLYECATPTLVPLIEIGDIDGAVHGAQVAIDTKVGEIDTLVLGCTHYTLLKKQLREKYQRLSIISQDEIIPQKLKQYLHRHPEIETKLSRKKSIEIKLSAESPEYDQIKRDFLIV